MVHDIVLEAYIHFALMNTIDKIFLALTIKYLINEDDYSTSPFKLAAGTKLSVSHLRVLFCPCVLRKSTAHIDKSR